MINKKYKSVTVLKQRNSKITEVAQTVIGNKKQVILKSYPQDQSDSISNEVKVYQNLKQPHLHGFPQVYEAFQFNSRYYLVMQQLGNNLQYLRIQCGGRLSLKTTLMVGIQALQRIEFLHNNGFLHGDIKPDNFLIGPAPKLRHKIYLIDFQLSKPYMKNGKHIEQENIDFFSGNLRFSSSHSNLRKNISRRDQIQSLLYCLVFFLKGELPWSQVNAPSVPQAYQITADLKKKTRKNLLEGLPEVFKKMFGYLDDIKFKDNPQYAIFKKSMTDLMKKNGYEMDFKYDWEYL